MRTRQGRRGNTNREPVYFQLLGHPDTGKQQSRVTFDLNENIRFKNVSNAIEEGWSKLLWYKGDWMQNEVAISGQKDMGKWKSEAWEGVRAGFSYMYIWPWTADDEESN